MMYHFGYLALALAFSAPFVTYIWVGCSLLRAPRLKASRKRGLSLFYKGDTLTVVETRPVAGGRHAGNQAIFKYGIRYVGRTRPLIRGAHASTGP